MHVLQKLRETVALALEKLREAGPSGQQKGAGPAHRTRELTTSPREALQSPVVLFYLSLIFGLLLAAVVVGSASSGLAQTPLTVVALPDTQYYAQTAEQRDEILKSVRSKKDVQVTRFKGLGEMNEEDLADTTMDKDKRRLAQVRIEEAFAAQEMFDVLMSEKVEPRKDFIIKHAKEVTNLDWHG